MVVAGRMVVSGPGVAGPKSWRSGCELAALESESFPGCLAIIVSGQAAPLRDLLRSSPVLAARFLAVIDFPGYAPGQLTAIFTTLAAEAGFTLTPDATDKTALVLAAAEAGRASGNARLAVGLLAQARARQARRLAAIPEAQDLVTLSTMCADDIPEYLRPEDSPADDHRPGQYL